MGGGVDANIMDGYQYLIENYQELDEIYLFGFSRGAYTARSLAGMIYNCGILKREYFEKLPEAYRLYRDRKPDTHPEEDKAMIFKKMYSHMPRIKFIGVWDTVGSLGIPLSLFSVINRKRYQFHDVKLSRIVDYAYHALAIDEQRAPFIPTLWRKSANSESQVLEQVWFPGVHSNVGGGYEDESLSDVPLQWMVTKAALTGLVFQKTLLSDIKPNPQGHMYDSMDCLYRFLGILRYGNFRTGGASIRPINNASFYLEKEKKQPVSPEAMAESAHEAFDRRHSWEEGRYRPVNMLKAIQLNPPVARHSHTGCSCDQEWEQVKGTFV